MTRASAVENPVNETQCIMKKCIKEKFKGLNKYWVYWLEVTLFSKKNNYRTIGSTP